MYSKFNKIITKEDIYFGTDDNLLSMLSILAKQIVYNSNRKDLSPDFKMFTDKVMYIQRIEENMWISKINFWVTWVERIADDADTQGKFSDLW